LLILAGGKQARGITLVLLAIRRRLWYVENEATWYTWICFWRCRWG